MYVRVPGQKRVLDPLELELGMVICHHVCWQLTSGPLQELQVYSITEPSLRCQ